MRRDALLCGLLLLATSHAAPPSASGAAPTRVSGAIGGSSALSKGRRLTGKFLHITDFHPDPFYKTYSSTTAEAACHRQRGPAGIYGAETSGCDSPYSLINQTFQWINDNIKNDVDFVIWTGDSARHDNDEALPRTQKQIIQQNEFMVAKFAEVFGQDEDKHGRVDEWAVPVVPTFGNNDIMPHNIFEPGPNRWTMKYLDIWRSFIPEAQRHQFQQGGWFSVEVIPSRLAVISLNTIYFFSSNSGVDGCANKHEPGFEHMEWLRIQLQILRERGMKAILMGHVPPARVDSKESWDETCWQKYTLWQRQFRDVIVGNLYGHMNIDHFMLQDFEQISKDAEKGRMASGASSSHIEEEDSVGLYEDGEVTVASASDYLLDLRQAWAQLPVPPTRSNKKSRSLAEMDDDHNLSVWRWLVSRMKTSKKGKADKSEKKKYLEKIGGKFAERYSVTHVSPSVVPNYYPTLRIIEYNITGLENLFISGSSDLSSPESVFSAQQPINTEDLDDDAEYLQTIESHITRKKKHKKHNKKGPRKYKFKVPAGPSKSSPPGPAYSPQTLTWTRYTQYFANLTNINNDFVESAIPPPSSSLTTTHNQHSPHAIFGLNVTSTGVIENKGWKEGKHGKHQGKQPRPEPHPKEFVFEVEYDTRKDKGFADLTVRRWVEYARKIGRAGRKSSLVAEEAEEDEDVEAQDEDEDESEGDIYEDEETNDEDDEFGVLKGKHGKKHKKKKKHHKASKEWYTFVKRAFVGTMNPKDIEQVFGASEEAVEETPAQEVMEL
ncbi:Metallo-dependent phosphatase-like protein [Paraphoma chrysanthemicola]|uniref:Endopolyphosphatase n=1 Tax=Paraphoma chrysanthemicola TaxID=798071 RepID=A0A8K0RJ05_9PLEO|nr:Metallo-dependent phosphatase-like protein [Paraphoma chrysanthemicola]